MKHASQVGYLILVWKITNPILLPHELKQCHKTRSILKVLKVAHANLLGMAGNTMHRNL